MLLLVYKPLEGFFLQIVACQLWCMDRIPDMTGLSDQLERLGDIRIDPVDNTCDKSIDFRLSDFNYRSITCFCSFPRVLLAPFSRKWVAGTTGK